jgi:hypothetical protein
MLWRRHHQKTQAPRKAEKRKKTDEDGWESYDSTIGISFGVKDGLGLILTYIDRSLNG